MPTEINEKYYNIFIILSLFFMLSHSIALLSLVSLSFFLVLPNIFLWLLNFMSQNPDKLILEFDKPMKIISSIVK